VFALLVLHTQITLAASAERQFHAAHQDMENSRNDIDRQTPMVRGNDNHRMFRYSAVLPSWSSSTLQSERNDRPIKEF